MNPWTSRVLVVCLILTSVAHAQEGMPPMGRPAEMDQVAFLIGEWDVTFAVRMAHDMPWTESEAHAVTEAILDGGVQRMTFTGEIMGMPLHGIDHLCFNRETGRFESVWMDDMSASFSTMSGGFEGEKLVLTGTTPRMGEVFHVRATSTKVGDDDVEWLMEESADGGETWYDVMKMHYARKK